MYEDEDEDNDGKFPDESPVEVRYPRGPFLLLLGSAVAPS